MYFKYYFANIFLYNIIDLYNNLIYYFCYQIRFRYRRLFYYQILFHYHYLQYYQIQFYYHYRILFY